MEKTIYLLLEKKNFHIEDIIQMPGGNPDDIYKKLDLDKSAYSKKFSNVHLYPSCYNGLISCEYYIRMMLETDTIFSTNEFANLKVDFYEAEKNNEENDNEKNEEDKKINIINNNATPIGAKFEKPLHSQTLKINNEKEKNIINMSKTFNTNKIENNNINININLKKSNNNNISILNNEMQTAQGEVNDGFEAPPSFINSDNKK